MKHRTLIFMVACISLLFLYATTTSARIIEFAGYHWDVKDGHKGPGPNYFSDSPQNVWVDAGGNLHLLIRYHDGEWRCAEIYSRGYARYGTHRFYVDGPVDELLATYSDTVVVGLFLYKDDVTELDIEFAQWGPSTCQNASYAIHPTLGPPQCDSTNAYEPFLMELSGTYTTHYINWLSSEVLFKSIHGHYLEPPNQNFLINEWNITRPENGNIPYESESLRVHLNLWLQDGVGPANTQDIIEIVITDVDLPITPGPPPSIEASKDEYTSKIRVTWISVPDATYYEVWRSTSDNISTASLIESSISIPLYDDDGDDVIPGRVYFYWVRSVNSYGPSDYSDSDYGRRSLTIPSNVQASDGDYQNQIEITWNEVYFANEYRVYRGLSPGDTPSAIIDWQTQRVCIDQTVNPLTTYYYWVKARNAYDESDYSNPDDGWMDGTVTVTLQTSPTGLSYTVDGNPYSNTQNFVWWGSETHNIGTSTPQGGGTGIQYIWSNWSDGGDIIHDVSTRENATYTANFNTQYYLTMQAGEGGSVDPENGWYNSGNSVGITATPDDKYIFDAWTGTGIGSYSGQDNPASVTMGGPIIETASFIHDIDPPENPLVLTSTSHQVEQYSTDNTVDIEWTKGSDAISGVDGYSFLWDESPLTLPAEVKLAEEDDTTHTSPVLADGNMHYFHLRTVDNVGNWTTDAIHIGPFWIMENLPSDGYLDLSLCSVSKEKGIHTYEICGSGDYISFPLIPDSLTVTGLLSDIWVDFVSIETQIRDGYWIRYVKDDPAQQDFTVIDPLRTYWIEVNSAQTFQVEGVVPVLTSMHVVTPDWNYIGFLSMHERETVPFIAEIIDCMPRVWTLNCLTWLRYVVDDNPGNDFLNDLFTIYPGNDLHIQSDCEMDWVYNGYGDQIAPPAAGIVYACATISPSLNPSLVEINWGDGAGWMPYERSMSHQYAKADSYVIEIRHPKDGGWFCGGGNKFEVKKYEQLGLSVAQLEANEDSIVIPLDSSSNWNLISWPLIPNDWNIDVILDGLLEKIFEISTTNSANPGTNSSPNYEYYYAQEGERKDFQELDPFKTYWFGTIEPCTLYVSGRPAASAAQHLQGTGGFCFSSYLGMDTLEVLEACSSIADSAYAIWTYRSHVWDKYLFEMPPDWPSSTLRHLIPGRGYQIHTYKDASWIYDTGYIGEPHNPTNQVIASVSWTDGIDSTQVEINWGDGSGWQFWSPHMIYEYSMFGTYNIIVRYIDSVGDTTRVGIDLPMTVFQTDVEEDTPDIRTCLSGCYPNPFNATIAIKYSVKHDAKVEIKIYDVAGRLIRVLKSGIMQTGDHISIWDGKDDRCNNVASGVYFLRFTVKEYSSTRKIILLR